MLCVKCRADVQPASRFCSQCGVAQTLLCPACRAPLAVGARFCTQCGTKAAAAPADPPPVVAKAGPERRHMTVMFCDLVGSTMLAEQLDPEDYHQLVHLYYEIVAAEVARFDGFVARHVGDGVLVYFGHPLAHEDDSERAIRAGLSIATRIDALDQPGGPGCHVRVGIATGLVVVDVVGHGSGTERTISGSTANLASRLQAVARPGGVVVAPSTYALVKDVFEFRELGDQALKGLDAVQVREVLKPRSRDDRRLAVFARSVPLIGRADEVGLLARRWAGVVGREGCGVLLSGEPGIGKSRIVQAFADDLAAAGTPIHYFHGSAHHEDSALHPVTATLGHGAGLLPDDTAEERIGKAEAFFDGALHLGPADRVVLTDLAAGDASGGRVDRAMTPRHRMERRLEALIEHVTGLAGAAPLLLVFEDAHWFDPSSRELIRQLIDRIAVLPVMILVTARPSYQPDWLGLAQVTLLHVNRLSRREGVILIRQVNGSDRLPDDVVEAMVERADGVPLYLEELTKTLVDETERVREGGPGLAPALSRATVPPTLQASLLSRLDRLSVARELAQEAASIGREFALDVIAAVTDRAEDELIDALAQLEVAGLLLRRGLPPRTSYYFRHALMQDAAYETLTRSKREALHRRIAEAYEARFQDIVETRPEILAHHLQQANLDQRAIEAWLRAAARALQRGAFTEAVAQLRRGLALVENLGQGEVRLHLELQLQLPLGNALMAARGYTDPETDTAFRRARWLCEQLGDTAQLMRIAWGQFTSCFAGGHLTYALAEAENLLVLAERRADMAGLQLGHASAGAALLHLGRRDEAEAAMRRALALEVPDARAAALLYGQSGRVTALSYLGLATLLKGEPDGAAALGRQAVAEALRIDHPTTVCFARSVACRTAFLQGDQTAFAVLAEQVAQDAGEQALPLWRALGLVYRGWMLGETGAVEEAVASVRQGVTAYRAVGAGLSLGLYLASLGSLEARAGRHAAALALFEEAVSEAERSRESWVMPELRRRLGDALAAAGQHGPAVDALHAGQALAERDGSAWWSARLAESLERLPTPARDRPIGRPPVDEHRQHPVIHLTSQG